MTKKDLKAFFQAIRARDLAAVIALIDSSSDYLHVCNVAPPKKDDGQSGLQVAFKTGNFEIARLLIERGADVNFIETSSVNEWTAPVLHDCIRATIFSSWTMQKDLRIFKDSFELLKLMLANGADANSVDSYGNNCLHRALMDARQMIGSPGADFDGDILLTQLRRVFQALISAGANPEIEHPRRPSARTFVSTFRLEEYRLF